MSFTLTLILEDELGTVKVSYEDISRESLESKDATAALLRLHDATMRQEEKSSETPAS